MKYRYCITLSTFFILIGTLTAQTTLKYSLKEGTVFKVKQQANQLITQKLEGSSHEITNDISGLYNFKVVSRDEKEYTLALSFEEFKLKTSSNLQGVLMDVDATTLVEGDIMSEMFNALIGHELSMRMKINGSVTSVEGGDELIKKMISAAGIEDEATIAILSPSLSKEFSSTSLAKSFEQMTFFYPDNEVAVGDSWENTYDGKLTANNTFTLEKIASNIASISGKSAIAIHTEESGTTMSLSGSQESAIEADIATGFINKIMISSLAEGTAKITQMGDTEIPTTIKSTITYELLEN